MQIINETLKSNNLTHGILNRFIKIASEKECSDSEFYVKMLFRGLIFHEELIKKKGFYYEVYQKQIYSRTRRDF